MRKFPWYEIVVDGQVHFLPLGPAGGALDNGQVPVSFGKLVLSEDGTTRPMTREDELAISEEADRHSESK